MRVPSRSRSIVYSLHKDGFSPHLKPASERSLDDFWSSNNFQIVARILATDFPVALHWLALLQEEVV